MKSCIYIIIDVSGSMNEMGKIHLQRNLCRYAAQLRLIDQEKYSDADIRFYQWAQNVSEVALQSDGDIPAFKAKGFSNLCALSDFFLQHMNDAGRSMVLVLSDGHFLNSDIVSFKNQLSIFPDLIIRTAAVGADSDLFKLKKISTNNTVYLSENIASAIDGTIFGSDKPLATPVSTTQILQSEPAETVEPEEDWGA
ncbi:MAG: VWA domain-containing protein [Candidatus Cloacimonetes bacterium]|nr:VWA domain-containing protein [Candidatus Cloacimonadota bacterium]